MPGVLPPGSGRFKCPNCHRPNSAQPVNDHQLFCSACQSYCGASHCLARTCTSIALGDKSGSWRCLVNHYFYARRCPVCHELGVENAATQAYVCGGGHSFWAQVAARCQRCDSGYLVTTGKVWHCEACDSRKPVAQ